MAMSGLRMLTYLRKGLGRVLAIAILTPVLPAMCGIAAASDEQCELARKNLQMKRQQLADHVGALQKASDENNLQALELLNIRINELIDQTRQLEKRAADCDAELSPPGGRGLRSSKSDESKYATKNCDELKRLLVPLVRKVHTLQRREKSLFTEFSANERADLDSAFEEVKTIEEILKTRCSPPKKAGPPKKRPRTSEPQ